MLNETGWIEDILFFRGVVDCLRETDGLEKNKCVYLAEKLPNQGQLIHHAIFSSHHKSGSELVLSGKICVKDHASWNNKQTG